MLVRRAHQIAWSVCNALTLNTHLVRIISNFEFNQNLSCLKLLELLDLRTRRLVLLIKLLSLSVIPAAALASLAIHLLIKYRQISVIDHTPGAVVEKDVSETIQAINGKHKLISHGNI